VRLKDKGYLCWVTVGKSGEKLCHRERDSKEAWVTVGEAQRNFGHGEEDAKEALVTMSETNKEISFTVSEA